MFIDEPNDDTITLSSLKQITQELGENMNNEKLKNIFETPSSNEIELNYDEFYENYN